MHQLTFQLRITCSPKYSEQVYQYLEDCLDSLAEILLGPIQDKGDEADFYFEGVNYGVDFDEIMVELRDDSLFFVLVRKNKRFSETDAYELEEMFDISEDTWRENGFATFDEELAKAYDVPEGLTFDLDTSTISFD